MNHWHDLTLGEVVRFERTSVQPENIAPGSLYLGLEHIESGGKILEAPAVEYGALASSKFEFGPQHLLYGKLRPYLAKVAAPDFQGVCSTDILPLQPGPAIDRRYLLHFLRRDDMVAWATARSTGANLPRISPGVLATMPMAVPPLEEQRRIAAILDCAAALRDKRRQALATVEQLTQSVFLEMFGAADALWPVKPVSECLASRKDAIRTGPFGSQLLTSEFVDDGIPVLGIDNVVSNVFAPGQPRFITPQKFEQLKRYQVFPGDLLITIMGTCGRCAVVPNTIGVAVNTKHLCCISLEPQLCEPVYFQNCFLHHPEILETLGYQARGAVMPGLNMGIIKQLLIPLPPLELQQQFARRVEAIEKLKAAHQRSLQEMDALFASLQHRAFRGEL